MKGARRKKRIMWAALVLLIGVGAGAAVLMGRPHSNEVGGNKGADGDRHSLAVKTIRPQRDPAFQVVTRQLATVEPYFHSPLYARASGTVASVAKGIGQRVRRDEVLIEIDVPELQTDIAIKEGVIRQRLREVEKARNQVKIATAHVDVAKANVELRQKEVVSAAVRRDLQAKRLERYRDLLAQKAIVPDVFDEQEREWKVSVAAVDVAEGAVKKAQADQKEMEASLYDAQADILLKETLVELARRDLERAYALADYARVYARFDGVITKRNVDPGNFVQNATSGSSEPLMVVDRIDLVTIVARVPEDQAKFIDKYTEAEVEIDGRSGIVIKGRISRFSPTVQNSDKTKRVEFDIFNDSEEAYGELKRQVVASSFSMLAANNPLEAIPLTAVQGHSWQGWQQSPGEPVPIRPMMLDTSAVYQPLEPGMSGTMTIRLSRTASAYLLPNSAVYSVNGKPYILLVKNGKSVQTPVKVQVEDGAIAKVDIVLPGGSVRELTPQDEVIASRQIEIGDGRAVAPTPSEWEIDRGGH
jgi:membrane fusion protein (multidrug efflux system)